ncbi:hypothetical protein GCM10009591_21110 [Brachybacterium tyrofermentans]
MKESSTTEIRGTKVKASTPSRFGAMKSHPTYAFGSEGARPVGRRRRPPAAAAGPSAASILVSTIAMSVPLEPVDERLGIGVDVLDGLLR